MMLGVVTPLAWTLIKLSTNVVNANAQRPRGAGLARGRCCVSICVESKLLLSFWAWVSNLPDWPRSACSANILVVLNQRPQSNVRLRMSAGRVTRRPYNVCQHVHQDPHVKFQLRSDFILLLASKRGYFCLLCMCSPRTIATRIL
jgi:hypothetical protein